MSSKNDVTAQIHATAERSSKTPLTDARPQHYIRDGLRAVNIDFARKLEYHARVMAEALEIIAGKRQSADNLLSNAEVAKEAVEAWQAFCKETLK